MKKILIINGHPDHLSYGTYYSMKKMTLEFCGIKPVKTTTIGPIRLSKDPYRQKWLERVEALGRALN